MCRAPQKTAGPPENVSGSEAQSVPTTVLSSLLSSAGNTKVHERARRAQTTSAATFEAPGCERGEKKASAEHYNVLLLFRTGSNALLEDYLMTLLTSIQTQSTVATSYKLIRGFPLTLF